MKALFNALIAVSFGWSGPSAVAQELDGLWANKQGISALGREESMSSYKAFSEAVNLDPGRVEYRLNLALVLQLNKEWDKAEKEYQLAQEMAASSPEVQFGAWFNRGILRSEKGDIPGALDAYQKALEVNPTSQEVKTNIELLWKMQNNSSGGKGQQKKESNENPSKQSEGGQDDQDQNQDPGAQQNEEPKDGKDKKPQSFEELNPEMARKILEELKAQEQKVRAEHLSQGVKEKPRDKQW